MGTLIGKAYPTQMALGLADHTYVECGTGAKGWECWGGKIGGHEICRDSGSTMQADAIAEPNERGGITCYLVNGVCHQAANRILWPAKVLVSAARGYWVSSSLFGTYGRVGVYPCHAPFDRHENVSGDLLECVDTELKGPLYRVYIAEDVEINKSFVVRAMELHQKALSLQPDDVTGHLAYQVDDFELQTRFRLGDMFSESLDIKLRTIRTEIETPRLEMELAYANEDINIKQFADSFNKLTLDFQDKMAETLKPEAYRAYFNLERGDRVILADPAIVDKLYAAR